MSTEEVSNEVPVAGTPEDDQPSTPDDPEMENKPEVSNFSNTRKKLLVLFVLLILIFGNKDNVK